jgi:pimeloyl-ACP methyl ester carboxylesterase
MYSASYGITFLVVLLTALSAAGCAFLRSGARPLNVVEFDSQTPRHDTLIVLLPGIGDRARDFERFGFVQAVRRHELPVDMIAVDAHLGYYLNNSLTQRLRQEVLLPAQRHGYSHIWLVGISLGAMGSMLYANETPLDIDGILAIAPYMGSDKTVADVKAAGGPRRWQPEPTLPGDFRPEAWLWLKGYRPGEGAPALFLAYGKDDRFAEAHELIADMLPPDRVIRLPGGHDWQTWLKLWEAVLGNLQAVLAPLQTAGADDARIPSAHGGHAPAGPRPPRFASRSGYGSR